MKSLISVIVPIYNVEKYLKRCIDSIINQTYKNLEIILVDDGSLDNCSKICDEYSKKDKRIRVIHKANGGLSDARNTGLDQAKGKYICFIDSDDYIDINMIKELYTNLVKTKSDISICDFVSFDEKTEKYNSYSNSIFIVKDSKYDLMFNEYRLVTTVQWNKLFKREIFDNLRFKYGKIHEDEFIICYELEKANKISFLLKPYYHYYQRVNSITGKFSINNFDAIDAIISQIVFFRERNMINKMVKSMLVCFSTTAILLLKARDNNIDKYFIIKYEKDNKKIGKEILQKYYSVISIKDKIKIILYIISPIFYYKLLNNRINTIY